MKNSREIDEIIERYCFGDLTPEELRIFEQWLESDPQLAASVNDFLSLKNAFENYRERLDLKKKIERIHEEVEYDLFNTQAPLKVVKSGQSTKFLFGKERSYFSIAAAVSIFILSAVSLSLWMFGNGSSKNQNAYRELRREVEKIKRNQKEIIKGINAVDSKEDRNQFTGTGFAITKDGYVLTSFHVIQDAKEIYISNESVGQLQAEVVYSDKSLDLAMLKVNEDSFPGFKEIPFGIKKSISDPGEKVFTLGFPREDLVFGDGSISSYTGFEGDTTAYQISIPVNPGNSGGPLFDNQGSLIGIISGKNESAEGASFAVKSKWINDYINSQEKSTPVVLPSNKSLSGVDRATQIKRLKDVVFMVRVYN
ncbi:MAG: trypsin-like peptidase domain-containing protein [Bacteroidota bacterium]